MDQPVISSPESSLPQPEEMLIAPESESKKPKLTTILLVIFVILLFAAGVFLATKLFGWETYRNEEYGFSFKYPSKTYQISESNLGNGDWKLFFMTTPVEQTARGITIIKGKSIQQIVEGMKSTPYREKFIEEKTIDIDGAKGKSILVEAIKGPIETRVILVEKNDFVYRFDWLDPSIISTFKFD